MENNVSEIADEFEKIQNSENYSTTTLPRSAISQGKNRYQNIVPYDYNRVVLDSRNGNDYINASYIEAGDRTKFIAAQGPTNDTVDQFWQMIFEQNVSDIVMLTQITENGKDKCFQYWPEDYETQFGKYTVTLESSVDFEDYIRREIRVSSSNKNSKLVTQWHYVSWLDLGVPSNLESFLKFHEVAMEHADMKSNTIVHCSSGVGRTGCFIAIDVLLEEAKQKGTADVVTCISKLIKQRPHMIQSATQYNLIYCVLRCSSTRSSTGIKLEKFHSSFLALTKGNNLDEEFQKLKKEITGKQGIMNSNSRQMWISSFLGLTSDNHHHISSSLVLKEDKFWNFSLQSHCLLVLVDHLKTWENHKCLPTLEDPVITENFCILLKKQEALGFGTFMELCIKYKDGEEHTYEFEDTKHKETLLQMLHVCSCDESFVSGELFQHAKQKIDFVNRNKRFNNLFVLSPDKCPLASYFVACCDLAEQLSSRKYVDVYRTVLELKRTPAGDTIALDQYRKLYKFIDEQLTKTKNIQINL